MIERLLIAGADKFTLDYSNEGPIESASIEIK
jgi:hypothetical protein